MLRRPPPRVPSSWPPRAVLRQALGTPISQNPSFIELADEEREVARRLAESRYVRLDGPPGTGKTHLAAAFALACGVAGMRVLYLCPRGPLSWWMRWNLEMYGVVVKTIHGHTRDVLERAGRSAVVRASFEDPDYFLAAREVVRPGEYHLVIGDEWQAASALEQTFARAVAGAERFIEVMDSSRDYRGWPPRELDEPLKLELTRSHRSVPVDLPGLADGWATEGESSEKGDRDALPIQVSAFQEDISRTSTLQAALDDFLRRGFRPSEIGIVSCAPRAGSWTLAHAVHATSPPIRRLGMPASSDALVADSVSYWLGLERKAIIVTGVMPGSQAHSIKVRNATSRASQALHVVLGQEAPPGAEAESGGRSPDE